MTDIHSFSRKKKRNQTEYEQENNTAGCNMIVRHRSIRC